MTKRKLSPMVEEITGETRLTMAKSDMTIGEFCRESLVRIVEAEVPVHSYQVLHEGSIYFIDVAVTAIKPPYTRLSPEEVEEGEPMWLGQRLS